MPARTASGRLTRGDRVYRGGTRIQPLASTVTPDAFHKLALELPGATAASHMRHPDFRVANRVFATLGYPNRSWGMVKLTPLQQSQFVAAYPAVFEPIPGGWGLRGATGVKLRRATVAAVRAALFEAWRNVAPKLPPGPMDSAMRAAERASRRRR